MNKLFQTATQSEVNIFFYEEEEFFSQGSIRLNQLAGDVDCEKS